MFLTCAKKIEDYEESNRGTLDLVADFSTLNQGSYPSVVILRVSLGYCSLMQKYAIYFENYFLQIKKKCKENDNNVIV